MVGMRPEPYEVRIAPFEGPMDLLLYLVQKNELDPKSISLAQIADQYLAWLALGATPRQAARPAVREAVSMSVMPATDQARTTGLVTLPGAFVGALFAGSSALEAARFQILVLAAILCANALTALVLTRFLGAPTTLLSDGQFTTRASAPAPAH